MFSQDDYQWMSRALELARRGRYTTAPNPCVGAVLVKAGVVVGEGWHKRAGEPHAEVYALRAAGDHSGQNRLHRSHPLTCPSPARWMMPA